MYILTKQTPTWLPFSLSSLLMSRLMYAFSFRSFSVRSVSFSLFSVSAFLESKPHFLDEAKQCTRRCR